MNPTFHKSARYSPPRLVPALLFLLGLLAPAVISAQSANNFAPQPAADAKPKMAEEVKAMTTPSVDLIAVPSRLVGMDIEAYVRSVTAVFAMAGRETDPFGQFQDPDAKPVVKQSVAKTIHRSTPVQSTPLSEIVTRIKVTTIMPGEKRFLVGTRSIAQGDRMPLNFRGKQIQIQVTSVRARQIDFRNIESGETAALKIEIMPLGMTPGNRGITAPGMEPANPNAPLEIESETDLSQGP